MSKVTYLFGAGASAICIKPDLVSEIKSSIANLEKEVIDDPVIDKVRQDLIRQCNYIENLVAGSTIDAYARQLAQSPNSPTALMGLMHLKAILSLWLSYFQLTRDPDPRYRHFYATLFRDEGKQLPDNVTILSWNYDSQFELAYADYCFEHRIENYWKSKAALKIVGKHSAPVPQGENAKIFQLNGNAADSTFTGSPRPLISYDLTKPPILLASYSDLIRSGESGVSFAYEKISHDNFDVISAASSAVKDTDILVVIGYSFAGTNYDVDLRLLRAMGQVEKVIIQDDQAFATVKKRIMAILGDSHLARQVKYFGESQKFFHCPNEIFG